MTVKELRIELQKLEENGCENLDIYHEVLDSYYGSTLVKYNFSMIFDQDKAVLRTHDYVT